MPSLYLTDIIKRAGLDPNRVKLIRHSFNHKAFKDSEADNMVREYTSLQKEKLFKRCRLLDDISCGPKYLGAILMLLQSKWLCESGSFYVSERVYA